MESRLKKSRNQIPDAPKPTDPFRKRKKRLKSKRSQQLNKAKCIEFDKEEITPCKLPTLKAASSQQLQSESQSQSLSQCTESDNVESLNIATMHAYLNLKDSAIEATDAQAQNDNDNREISTKDNNQFDDSDNDSPERQEVPLMERVKAKRQTKILTKEKARSKSRAEAKKQRKNVTKEKARSKSRGNITNAAN